MTSVSYLQINDFACIRGRVVLPLTGCWVADVVSDPVSATGSFPPPGGAITMTIGGQSFAGVVRRSSNPFGTTFARLIGGAGGLPQTIGPMAYQNVTVQTVLGDILDACGETLAANADPAVLSQSLAFWVRMEGPGWLALSNLMDAVGEGTWRVLPNGQIWVGVDQWPTTSLQTFELLSYLPHELRAEIYADTPTLLPGQLFLGGHVESVEHIIEPAKIHSSVLFADAQLAALEAA